MPILLAAIIETLIYLAAIPVSGAFVLSTANGLRYGVGVGVFGLRGALRRARRYRAGGKGGPGLSWDVVRRLRGARIRVRGALGLGDAASTALACGALRALGAGRAVVDVTPVFDGDGLCLELQGMIRLRSGQIMWAMAMSQLENIRRRIARWTDTRLKA